MRTRPALTLPFRRLFQRLLLFLCCLPFFACKNKEQTVERCVELDGLAGICAGVETQVLGSGTWHTADTGQTICQSVIFVKSGATGGNGTEQSPFGDLPQAAAAAVAGDCIALAAGTYSAAALPDSVSLLGKGSAKSTVTASGSPALTITGGSNALVRGVRLTGNGAGLDVANTDSLTVESVAIENTISKGLSVRDATEVSLQHVRIADIRPATDHPDDVGVGVLRSGHGLVHVQDSLVENCQGSGLISYRGNLFIDSSVFRNNIGYGIAAACSETACLAPPSVTILASLIEDNQGVGIWLKQVEATIQDNTLTGTARERFGYSRSMEAVETDDLQFVGNTVVAGESMGLFLHKTAGRLNQNTISSHGGRGVWIQNVGIGTPLVVEVSDNQILDNHQVGVGILGNCDVTVSGGTVGGTILTNVATEYGNIQQGDGIQALPGSTVTIDTITFNGNDRKSVLADGVDFVAINNSEFRNEPDDPIAVQEVGANDIQEAIDQGILEATENTDGEGGMVSPFMSPEPLGCDKSEVSVSAENLQPQ